MADFNINPESFRFNQEPPEAEFEGVSFTEEDMEEVEIYRCPICDDMHGNKNIQICEYHQNNFN